MTEKTPARSLSRLWSAPYLLLTIVTLAWAGNALVGRAARELIPPLTLAFVRWSGALLILAPFAWPKLKADWPALKAKAGIIVLLGLLGVTMFNALLYTGVHYTTATNALLMQAAIPPATVLVAYLLYRETVSWPQLAAVALSAAGVIVIVAQGSLDVLLGLKLNPGDALILIAVAGWAFYTVLLRRRPSVHPLSFLAASFAVGVVTMAPASAFELAHGHRVTWGAPVLGALIYVAVFPSLIAYSLFTRSVDLIGASPAGQFINLMPLFGAGLAVLLLGEPLAPYHFLGGLLIVAGVAGFAAIKPAKP